MRYEELKSTAPYGCERLKSSRRLTAWQVLLFFVIDMIIFIFAGSYIQYYLGMPGVAITELWLLASSLVFVRLMRADFKKTFPIKKPRPLAFVGVLIIWLAGFFCMIICNLILLILFPEGMLSNSSSFNALLDTVPWPLTFLIVAVLPAVCEEAMHRGVIQCGIQNRFKNPWTVILIMGILFGVFHLSPVKFLGTGILGAVMTWILLRTGNMIYSSFFHFFHNGMQLLFVFILPGILETTFLSAPIGQGNVLQMGTALLFSLGLYIAIFGTAVPILFYVGHWLLQKSVAPVKPTFLPKGREKVTLCKIFIPTGIILCVGIVIANLGFSEMIQILWFN